jgi:uncharacterized membrane protein YeaQ/YmgE (transglycosylase-associated protein family)
MVFTLALWMWLFWWILIGGLVGWIATRLMGERQPLGIAVLIGMAGAVVGGLLLRLLGVDAGNALLGFLAAVLGAVILIAIVRAVHRPHEQA